MILGLLASAALAGTPVVFEDGTGPDAVAQVARRTGLPAHQLEAVPLRSLLDHRPLTLGGAALRHCSGQPASRDEIRAAAVRGEAAWRDGDAAAAMDHLDQGMARLGCLQDRVEAPVVARIFLLRGSILAREGDPSAGRDEVLTALSLQPDLAWDEWLPPAGRPLLQGLRDDPTRVTLGIAPGATAAGPWIDGRAVPDGAPEVSLRPGLHLVQVASTGGMKSAWLTLSSDGALVVPGSFKAPVLPRLSDAEQRLAVERLLQASFPGEAAAYGAARGGLWMTTLGEARPETEELLAVPEAEPEAPPRKKRRR